MKTRQSAFLVLLISLCVSAVPAKADISTCNTLLSGESPELTAAIHDLSKLRYDLDVAVSQGENSAAKRAMQMRYDEKEKEILHSAKINQEELIARIRAEIESIQKEINTQKSRRADVKEEEQKKIQNAERLLKVGSFVKIPAGKFMMGDGDFHEVTLTRDFEMQTTAVTQQQFLAVMGENPSYFQEERNCPETWVNGIGCPENPVEGISWNDAQAFLQQLNAEDDGYFYRLPTEAEWEYAARAGTTTVYYWGNSMDDDYAWHGKNSNGHTHEVAKKKPNAHGLYDMSGNVLEWVNDWYDTYPSSAVVDPEGPSLSDLFPRVLRGGSWVSNAEEGIRSDSGFRHSFYPDGRGMKTIGFRLARVPRNPSQ